MRIAVITARYPQAAGKGDQSRAMAFVRHLAERNDVLVVTPGRPATASVERALLDIAHVVRLPAPAALRVASAAVAPFSLRPAQVGWMMPGMAWRRIPALVADADSVLVMTIRALRGPLPRPVVLDHVDALSLNMSRRAHSGELLPARIAASYEARALRRWEACAAGWVHAQVATSAEDAANLPPPPAHVLPVGLEGGSWDEPAGHERPIDVVFTGNMRYPPNADAARWIAGELAPRLRLARSDVRVAVVGRDARRLGLRGIAVHSDVPDVLEFLRRAKVALAPLNGGTGSPYKVLEAAASGAAVVAAPWVAERFELPIRTAEGVEGYASQVLDLLNDSGARADLATRAAYSVRSHGAADGARRVEALLLAAAGQK